MNVTFILWCLLLSPFVLWIDVLLVQVACTSLPVPASSPSSRRPRVAVMIPAHNEEKGILRTLRSIMPQLRTNDRLLVVADNCDDDTARVVLAAGAEVAERNDLSHCGKGYALDHGVRYLAKDAPEVVIVIDADCNVEADTVDSLARACDANGRPMQALYLMRSTRPGTLGSLREFAWIVRNLVRPLGHFLLGQPCQLMGTGMAFPWPLIAAAPLANSHLVEDMQLGVDLARAGAAPLFCPQALVTSEFPINEAGIRQQRRRWEHGHLGMILGRVPSMLADALKSWNGDLLALALDTFVPPLALLLLLLLALAAFSMATSSSFGLAASMFLLWLLVVAMGIAWWRYGRGILKLRTLLLAPVYALAKIPLYLGFILRRQREWVRTRRG